MRNGFDKLAGLFLHCRSRLESALNSVGAGVTRLILTKSEIPHVVSYSINKDKHCGIGVQTVENAFAPPKNPDKRKREGFLKDEWKYVKKKLENTIKFVKHVKNSGNQFFVPWRSAHQKSAQSSIPN